MQTGHTLSFVGAAICGLIVGVLAYLRQYAHPESFLEVLQILISFAGAALIANALLQNKQTAESRMAGPSWTFFGGIAIGAIVGTTVYYLGLFPQGTSLYAGLAAMLFTSLLSLWRDWQIKDLRGQGKPSAMTS